jgi:hypothetical protein
MAPNQSKNDPKVVEFLLSCRVCRKPYRSLAGYLAHRCLPGEGTGFPKKVHFCCLLSETPRYYQGKIVGVNIAQQGCWSNNVSGIPMHLHTPFIFTCWHVTAWKATFVEYTGWSTAEIVQGRPWPMLAKSSAKQVVGTIRRLLRHSARPIPTMSLDIGNTLAVITKGHAPYSVPGGAEGANQLGPCLGARNMPDRGRADPLIHSS